MNYIQNAADLVAHELIQFSGTLGEEYREEFFHPMNRDEWIARFCAWLSAKQRTAAEIRASND